MAEKALSQQKVLLSCWADAASGARGQGTAPLPDVPTPAWPPGHPSPLCVGAAGPGNWGAGGPRSVLLALK